MNTSETPRMDAAFRKCGKTPRMNWQASQCYEEGCKLERELASWQNLAASSEILRKKAVAQLAAAKQALMDIEERFVDGCDTYEDWLFMGDTARAALGDELRGPWTAVDGDRDSLEVHDADGGLVCTPHGETIGEVVQRAAAIASTPQLLQQLGEQRAILSYWRDTTECVCQSEKPIGACLRCDIEACLGQAKISTAICALQWNKGPANGGEGTAGHNRWWDGDLLLIVVQHPDSRSVALVHVSADEHSLNMIDPYTQDDITEWSFDDISWWCKIEDQQLPPKP